METHCAVYYMIEIESFLDLVTPFWDGTLYANHVLWPLYHPVRQCGEVTAWGGAHVTLVDDGITGDLSQLTESVGAVASSLPPMMLEINTEKPLDIFGTALVVRLVSAKLAELRARLIKDTCHLFCKAPITDATFQFADWWIRSRLCNVTANLRYLEHAWQIYQNANAPLLPQTRHFALGHLVKLVKEAERAKGTDRETDKAAALEYFLEYGQPSHYRKLASGIHTTIASGLLPTTDRASLIETLETPIRTAFEPIKVNRIAIMTEDWDSAPVAVQFWDWLTETFVEETRRALKVHEFVPLKN